MAEEAKTVVDVVISRGITEEQLTELFVRIANFRPNSCSPAPCGLLGIDLRMTGQDPEFVEEGREPTHGVHSFVVS
jgi:hypothetical protein